MYNLKFKLPCILERLSLPIKACNNEDIPITPITCPNPPYSKVSSPVSRPQKKVK